MQRSEAHRLGATTYITGKPCRHGHVGERWTCNGVCRQCQEGYVRLAQEKARNGGGDTVAVPVEVGRMNDVLRCLDALRDPSKAPALHALLERLVPWRRVVEIAGEQVVLAEPQEVAPGPTLAEQIAATRAALLVTPVAQESADPQPGGFW